MLQGADDDAQVAPSIHKAFAILRAFRPDEQYLGNKEIGERTQLSPSTVSRITSDLVRLGYLRYSSKLGQYSLGIALLSLAYPFLSGVSLRHVARPYMERLGNAIGGQVSLGMRHRSDIIYIESSRSVQHILSSPEIGAAIPIFASAIGRAYLTALRPVIQKAVIEELKQFDPQGWERFGSKVRQAQDDFKRLGFTRSLGDIRKEIRSCGIALRVRVDDEIVVMNCGVPAYQLKRGQLEREIGPQLVTTARSIESALGLR